MELGLAVSHVIAFAVGAVFSYLFLRVNRNKKAALDKWVDENKPK